MFLTFNTCNGDACVSLNDIRLVKGPEIASIMIKYVDNTDHFFLFNSKEEAQNVFDTIASILSDSQTVTFDGRVSFQPPEKK